jgi:hypothetical protein
MTPLALLCLTLLFLLAVLAQTSGRQNHSTKEQLVQQVCQCRGGF